MIKLPRAFLSHSSTDKDIVGQVAAHLGRAAVIFDAFEFKAGDDFRDAILSGLERSDIFVLFASRKALTSDWVKLEIKTASEAIILQALSRVVTYIVDDELKLEELPEWMRSTLIVRQSRSGLIAVDIRRLIGRRVSERLPTYFVGRRNETEEALEIISGFTKPDFRPPLIIYGLKGIGRRSLVQAIGRDSLSFGSILTLQLNAGDLLPEVSIRLLDAVSPGSVTDYPALLKTLSEKPQGQLVAELLDTLRSVCTAGALPVLVDEGAIANPNGVLRAEFEALYNAIAEDRHVDAMIVTGRRLYGFGGASLPSVRVSELDHSSTQNLLRIAGRDVGLAFERPDLISIATYSRGYPPAVRFAIDEARARGIPQVLANQRALVNFSAELFLRQLKQEESMNACMVKIMQLLSGFSPLPQAVIAEYCNLSAEQAAVEMDSLLDLAFIVPQGVHYRISEPLRDAAYRAFGGMSIDSSRVGNLLEAYLAEEPNDDARLDLGQSIFRAALLAGKEAKSKFAVGFAADLIHVATQSYHDQDYGLAIRYGSAALEQRPDNVDLRRYVAQALIRRERYEEADEHINALVKLGELKEAFYVQGFAARRKREYADAVEAYKKSLANGRNGVAIHRELASCYFELGELKSAEAHIRQAEEKSPHNRYVVDLRCTIALRLGDIETAARMLQILERVDPSGFSDHRKSTIEQAQGETELALRHARTAVAKIENPPFEVMANLANCEIEAGDADGAVMTLTTIQQRFGGTNHDAQIGLRCKYEIRFGTVEAAEGLWQSLRNHNLPVHRGLRLSILHKKNTSTGLNAAEDRERQNLMDQYSTQQIELEERMIGSVMSQSD